MAAGFAQVMVGFVFGISVTTAEADLLASAWLVAVTVTVCCAVQVLGAEYMPAAEIVPIEGLIDQVTAVLVVLLTVAVNCWLWLALRFTEAGLTLTETAAGATVTVALADFVESAAEVAVTVTTSCAVAPLGAV